MLGIAEIVRFPRLLTLAALVLLFLQTPSAGAASGEDAEAFIRGLAANATTMLETKFETEKEREEEFRRIVGSGFAMNTIGRFVVGRHWRRMSDEQKTEYQALFQEWLLRSYAVRLRSDTGQRFNIVKTIEVSKRDTFVRTEVVQAGNRSPFIADWRVRKINGDFKIIDIVVEGVSMAAAHKSEFDAVIRKVGVEGLIENLRTQLATISANTG